MNKAPEKRRNMFSANVKWSKFFGIWQTHRGADWDLREAEEAIQTLQMFEQEMTLGRGHLGVSMDRGLEQAKTNSKFITRI